MKFMRVHRVHMEPIILHPSVTKEVMTKEDNMFCASQQFHTIMD